MRIDVYDEPRKEWRAFTAVGPALPATQCGNGLHQFYPDANVCACGALQRAEPDRVKGKES